MRRYWIVVGLLVAASLADAQDMPPAEKQWLLDRERNSYTLLHGSGLSSAASPEIDVTYYFLNLTISTTPAPSLLSGAVEIRAVNRSDSLEQVVLDLRNTMTVDSVVSHGRRISFSQQPATLTAQLERRYRANEVVDLTVVYHGVPAATGFGSFIFSSHEGTPWVWSLSEPYGSRDWWPSKDHPSDKADSADIWITCDARFRAGSNGTLTAVIDNGNGTKTWRWSERYPIASYLISIAVTNFTELDYWFRYTPTDSMPVVNYVLPELAAQAAQNLPKTVDMLRIFSDAYGLYPFIKEKYGHASMGSGGAMEHQTMTSTTSFQEYVVAHELAHQWFGDMITCRTWVELWLNEGFARYNEAIYGERMYGSALYHGYIETMMNNAKKATAPLRPVDTSSVGTLFAASGVYDKGASVLHMLRRMLGDSVFFHAMKAYAADPALRYGTATTADFRRVCEAVSGKDLGTFFGQWTDGLGYPAYRYGWSVKPDGESWIAARHLEQTNGAGAPTLFAMPLDLQVKGDGWDTTVTIVNSMAAQDYQLSLRRKPFDLRLDPGNWVLSDKLNLNDEASALPTEFRLYPNYPNPFNPATTITFDLPHRSYVTLTIHNVLGEEVARLVDGFQAAGRHAVQWDGTLGSGVRGPSGVYFYYVKSDDGVRSGRMVLQK